MFATGSYDDKIRIYKLDEYTNNFQLYQTISDFNSNIHSVSINSDGTILVGAGIYDQKINIYKYNGFKFNLKQTIERQFLKGELYLQMIENLIFYPY